MNKYEIINQQLEIMQQQLLIMQQQLKMITEEEHTTVEETSVTEKTKEPTTTSIEDMTDKELMSEFLYQIHIEAEIEELYKEKDRDYSNDENYINEDETFVTLFSDKNILREIADNEKTKKIVNECKKRNMNTAFYQNWILNNLKEEEILNDFDVFINDYKVIDRRDIVIKEYKTKANVTESRLYCINEKGTAKTFKNITGNARTGLNDVKLKAKTTTV